MVVLEAPRCTLRVEDPLEPHRPRIVSTGCLAPEGIFLSDQPTESVECLHARHPPSSVGGEDLCQLVVLVKHELYDFVRARACDRRLVHEPGETVVVESDYSYRCPLEHQQPE